MNSRRFSRWSLLVVAILVAPSAARAEDDERVVVTVSKAVVREAADYGFRLSLIHI